MISILIALLFWFAIPFAGAYLGATYALRTY